MISILDRLYEPPKGDYRLRKCAITSPVRCWLLGKLSRLPVTYVQSQLVTNISFLTPAAALKCLQSYLMFTILPNVYNPI